MVVPSKSMYYLLNQDVIIWFDLCESIKSIYKNKWTMGMAMDSVTVAKIIREFFSKDKKKMINEISTLHFQFLTKFWFVFFLCHIETYKRLIIGWMWFLLAFCVYFVWYILNHSRHDLEGSANKKKVLVVALDRKKLSQIILFCLTSS